MIRQQEKHLRSDLLALAAGSIVIDLPAVDKNLGRR